MSRWFWSTLGFVPILGFFGNQAVRLLRETWDGVVKANLETGEVRPHGATLLAEELYAMLDDDVPQTQNAPVTINVPPEVPGLTINTPGPGGNPLTINGGTTTINGNADIGRNPTAGVPGDTVNIGGDTITLGGPPGSTSTINLNGDVMHNGDPLGTGGGGGGTGTSAFLGKVVSGSGDTYQVAIYGNGPNAGATGTVTATVPQIDPDEEIPPDTWIACVHQFGEINEQGDPVFTYAFQPPIWIA